jgi:hypothetical protein
LNLAPVFRPARSLLLCLLLPLGAICAHAATADLMRLTEQLDKLDQLDFEQAIEKAEDCTRVRDFDCSETELRKARKRATGSKSKVTLTQAEHNLAQMQRRVQREEREYAEKQRQLELAEAKLREAEERAEEQARQQERAEQRAARDAERQAEQEQSHANTLANIQLAGALFNQAMRNQIAAKAAGLARNNEVSQMQASVSASVARDQERFAQERARLEAQRSDLKRQQADAQQQMRDLQQQRSRDQQEMQRRQQEQLVVEKQRVEQQHKLRDDALRVQDERAAQERPAKVAEQKAGFARSAGTYANGQAMQPTISLGSPVVAKPREADDTQASRDTRVAMADGGSGSSKRSSSSSAEKASSAAPKAPAEPTDPREPDSNGCIDTIGWCSTPQSVERKGTTTILRFTNTCPFRVYGTFANGIVGGRIDAGADGVRPGAKHSWTTQNGDGRSYIRIVGSVRGDQDWVCSGKYGGFQAGDSTLDTRKKK